MHLYLYRLPILSCIPLRHLTFRRRQLPLSKLIPLVCNQIGRQDSVDYHFNKSHSLFITLFRSFHTSIQRAQHYIRNNHKNLLDRVTHTHNEPNQTIGKGSTPCECRSIDIRRFILSTPPIPHDTFEPCQCERIGGHSR